MSVEAIWGSAEGVRGSVEGVRGSVEGGGARGSDVRGSVGLIPESVDDVRGMGHGIGAPGDVRKAVTPTEGAASGRTGEPVGLPYPVDCMAAAMALTDSSSDWWSASSGADVERQRRMRSSWTRLSTSVAGLR